jgi:hypothetical protein
MASTAQPKTPEECAAIAATYSAKTVELVYRFLLKQHSLDKDIDESIDKIMKKTTSNLAEVGKRKATGKSSERTVRSSSAPGSRTSFPGPMIAPSSSNALSGASTPSNSATSSPSRTGHSQTFNTNSTSGGRDGTPVPKSRSGSSLQVPTPFESAASRYRGDSIEALRSDLSRTVQRTATASTPDSDPNPPPSESSTRQASVEPQPVNAAASLFDDIKRAYTTLKNRELQCCLGHIQQRIERRSMDPDGTIIFEDEIVKKLRLDLELHILTAQWNLTLKVADRK